MQQCIRFIQAWLTRRYTKTELCRQFNISRPTADKWIKRHQQVGFDGLAELSRRPKHSPNATPQWISEWLVAEKLKRPDWGALNLFAHTFPEQHKPADSTGDLILARADLVKPRKRRHKVSADTQPFNECTAANSTWSADFKGQFLLGSVDNQQPLGNNKLCYPLTVTDHFNRYLLLCQALSGTQRAPVTALFERLFTEFGLPWAIRSDNGAPFASTALGGISHLSKWWIDLGIRPERIQPAHPEQNGRHERMHRSLKDSLHARLDKMEQDLCAQQV